MAPPAKTNSGFYVMARGWQDHELFEGDRYSRRDAWCWLIEHARFKPSTTVVEGVRLQVGRRELTVSIRGLANLWGWSKSSSNRFLAQLRNRDSIRTRSGTGRGTGQLIITICNYEKFQLLGHLRGTATGTATGTPTGTVEEEGKEGKNIGARIASAPTPPEGSDGPSDPPGEKAQVAKRVGAPPRHAAAGGLGGRAQGRMLPEWGFRSWSHEPRFTTFHDTLAW